MRKLLARLLIIGLLAVAVCCSVEGYRNYRLFVRSHGTSEQNIRLDAKGIISATVDPPGRSLFRPGGVLEIFVLRNGAPIELDGVTRGRGTLRVRNHEGHLLLEKPLDDLTVTTQSGRGQYYGLIREFDTSRGGPYRIEFEITEPFKRLEGTQQKVVARHFVCGQEALIHYLQFGLAGLSAGLALLLVFRVHMAKHLLVLAPRVPVGTLVMLTTTLFCQAAESAPERELVRDPHFRRGFTLLRPEPGKRVAYGVVRGHETASTPVWDLDQWSSKHPLTVGAPEQLADGSLLYSNVAKTVTLGVAASDRGDLGMAVRASTEYGKRARRSGEPWVHLLVEQTIANPPSLAELRAARLHVEARLIAAEKLPMTDYSPGLHAAQFQIFFSVQNLNRQSPGYGHYLWFGIPIYDDRHRIAPGHKAQDTGGTSMFIYTPSGNVFSAKSAHDREWITIDQNLLPLMREGLEYAWGRNFLRESLALADYRIAGMNLGWEVPGIFEVDLQIRQLSLKVSYADTNSTNPTP